MNMSRLRLFTVASAVAVLASCATSKPNSVKLPLGYYDVAVVENKSSNLEFAAPVYRERQTIAAIDISDGPNVADLRVITAAVGNEQLGKPVAAPNRDDVLYTLFTEKTSGIYRQSLGSSARSPILREEYLTVTPTFTTDGYFTVFSSDRSTENQSLWRKRSDGAGGITQITNSSSLDWYPAVAKDGETVVFQSHRRPGLESYVWSINMNGGLLTQLTLGSDPKLSPDGRKIAFTKPSNDGKHSEIWTMLIDGSSPTQLSSSVFNDIDPSWHPSGKYIVFASDEGVAEAKNRDYNIWLMAADGTGRTRLTQNFSHDDAPVFDHRGQNIIFRSNRGGSWGLWVFKPELK